VEILSTDESEVFAYGIYDQYRLRIGGQNPGWRIDSISAPSGGSIDEASLFIVEYLALGDYGQEQLGECDQNSASPACQWECALTMVPCDEPPPPPPAGHCNDSNDNDDDSTTDSGDAECAHQNHYGCNLYPDSHHWESGESFALMGTGRYCTDKYESTGNWFTQMLLAGWNTAALVNMLGPFEPEVPERRLRFVAGGCWVFPSIGDAEDCDFDGTCSTYASSYPYSDAGASASNYYGNVWLDVDHAADVGLGEPISLASALYLGTGTEMTCGGGELNCCGAEASAGTDCSLDGASVVQVRPGSCQEGLEYTSIAHEFGHNLGLNHDDASKGPSLGGGHHWSFMNSSSDVGAALCTNNQSQLTSSLGAEGCPRLPGFGYVGGASCSNCAQASCS
jgi:hypothetical protein